MLSIRKKIILIVFSLLFMVALVFFARAAYFKNKWINEQFKVLEQLEVRIDTLDKRQFKINELNKDKALKSRNNNKRINGKLKQDEKDIDNRVVNDAELELFLSRFKNKD